MPRPHLEAAIYVDLTEPVDYPLSKSKFAVFNSGLVPAATYRRDEAAFRRARPESVRVDIGWGAEWMGREHDVVRVSSTGVEYDFTDVDQIGAFLTSIGVRPYWSYCYVPAPHRPEGGDWRDLDEDMTGWAEMVRAYVEGAAERGVAVGYHEVYNEPDLRDERTGEAVFFGGDLRQYLDLYRMVAPVIRKADPNTPVGGPALALVLTNEHWIPLFLDTVANENLPLDFFSFHHYGTGTVHVAVDKVLNHFESRPDLNGVEIHLNEYNSYPVDYPRGGLQDGYHMAAAMLADFARFLSIPALTKVSWAQFLDSGHDNYSGMVDIDGGRKPVLSAYEFYQGMPVDRRRLTIDGPPEVGGLAAAEPGRAAVLLWNRAPDTVRATLAITGVDGAAATVRRIDADHDGSDAEAIGGVAGGWTAELARGAVVLLELGVASEVAGPAGRASRVRHRYARRRSSAWADLDEATTTFRLGTAGDPEAVPVVTAELTECGPVMTVDSVVTGATAPTGQLILHIRGVTRSVDVELGMGRQETTVDLAALGADSAATVSVSLTGAAPQTFATVRLS